MSQYAELILFFLVGAVTGLLADQGRRRREQLEAATRQLQESFEQVKRADRLSAVGQLSASLAHEIRNPLGSIEVAANIIRSPATSEEIREGSLNIIQKQCQRLNRLLTNLLDFARPQPPEFRSVDLSRLIDSILALVGPNAQHEHITLKKTILHPPARIREHRREIRFLVDIFSIGARCGTTARICDCLMPYYCAYRWPGNVGELEEVVEQAVLLSEGKVIRLQDLPESLRRERPDLDSIGLDLPPGGISLDHLEKELILLTLEKFQGNQTHAARYLDLSRKTLIYRMEKYGLRKRHRVSGNRGIPDGHDRPQKQFGAGCQELAPAALGIYPSCS